MRVARGCRAVPAEGGQWQSHGPLQRVPILRRGTRADGCGGCGINHQPAAMARATNVRLRSPWNSPSGSATGAPLAMTRGPAVAAEAFAFLAFALPLSATFRLEVLALPPLGVKVTLST